MKYSWTCHESVGNLGTPKFAWGKVLPQKLTFDGQRFKESDCNCERKFSKCQWGHWPYLLVGENVTTLLWGKCEVATHTSENGTWESSETLKNSKLNCMHQNTLHWNVLYTLGKTLKFRCPKWPRMSHLDICSTSYGWKKGRESNWQFDSQPLIVENQPDSGVCRWSATHCWKALKESYKFALDLIPIRGQNEKLWMPKMPKVQTRIVSGLHFGSHGKKCHLDASVAERRREYYMGEVGGFPWVRAVVSQVSPRSHVACPNTKSVQNEF